ncbi:hypothetical protein MBLNU457_2160t1 [Dothideomycetes sp. NU457]
MSTSGFYGRLFDCGGCGPCMGAFCCTACLYGRYAQRLESYPRRPAEEDPMSTCNNDCAMFWMLGSVSANFLPVWFKRTEHRRRFNIEAESSVSAVSRLWKLYTVLTVVVGNSFKDCCTTYWCLPRALAQQNLDIQERAKDKFPVTTATPYMTGEKMTYSRPQEGGVVTATTETVVTQ